MDNCVQYQTIRLEKVGAAYSAHLYVEFLRWNHIDHPRYPTAIVEYADFMNDHVSQYALLG